MSEEDVMDCPVCGVEHPLQDMRSFKGDTLCKDCFAKERQEEEEAKRKKPSGLRLKGRQAKVANVWMNPEADYPLVGLTDENSVFFAALPQEGLMEAASAIRAGKSPTEALENEPLLMPLKSIDAVRTTGKGTAVEIEYGESPHIRTIKIILANTACKNQLFGELGKSLGDNFACVSKLARDWKKLNPMPFIMVVAIPVITILIGWLANRFGGSASPELAEALGYVKIAFLVGPILMLASLVWCGITIQRAEGTPKLMNLVKMEELDA